MPPALQAKLLRVIEDKRVRPLGSTEEMPVELRVVAATNIDLEQAIAAGKFRRDLYYRLATVAIEVPPLRERPQDLGLLIRYFLVRAANEAGKKVPCLAPEVLECFRRYAWPGNVRELQNVIQGSMLLCRKDSLTMADLPGRLVGKAHAAAGSLAEAAARRLSLEEIERAYVRLVMDQAANNKTEAAAILQIDRKTLYRKLEERDELTEC